MTDATNETVASVKVDDLNKATAALKAREGRYAVLSVKGDQVQNVVLERRFGAGNENDWRIWKTAAVGVDGLEQEFLIPITCELRARASDYDTGNTTTLELRISELSWA